MKKSVTIPIEFSNNSQRILKELLKNCQRIPKKRFCYLKILIIPAILNSRLEFEIPFELVLSENGNQWYVKLSLGDPKYLSVQPN